MSFRIIALDDGADMVSSAMDTKDEALDYARDLRRDGLEVLRIERRGGEVAADAAEIIEWCLTAPPNRARPHRRA
ncbi:DUF2188 domain-containing protein [Beijerinckia sp. L45]|uniref:DUF2188 domain-containing protein n=1 Tax=Beijerinckia sp. L45 TaxID=1641855 RepID=UPI00131E308E|nr:DUF2188 domain-containing protein [Beijerinckia sp. L45]